MLCVPWFFLVSILGGCPAEDTAKDPSGETDCVGAGISATGEAWMLPTTAHDAADYPFQQSFGATSQQDCGGTGGYWYYYTMDMTGDALPDLLITRSDCDDDTIGEDQWELYRGTGAGFGDAERWTLPPTELTKNEHPYTQTSNASAAQACGTSNAYWYFSTTDLTGDGIPDIVVTRSDCDNSNLGRDRWMVYPGTGSGFDAGQEWMLPTTALTQSKYPFMQPFAAMTAQTCGSDTVAWYYSVTDLTGDGIPDFVVTRSECDDPTIGQDHWMVYPGTGAGYGDGQTWTLPASSWTADEYPYEQTSVSNSTQACPSGDTAWSYGVTDFTGDDIADLVVTRNGCDDSTLGQDHWTVYPGTGSGFGAAETWALPSTQLTAERYPFAERSTSTSQQDCAGERTDWYYATMDLTGDAMVDLVVTGSPCDDPAIGQDRWVVYRGNGAGFGAAETWTMPTTGFAPEGYPYLKASSATGSQDCGEDGAAWYYSTAEMNGDGVPDFVVTRNECDDPTVGQDRWMVYPGECG